MKYSSKLTEHGEPPGDEVFELLKPCRNPLWMKSASGPSTAAFEKKNKKRIVRRTEWVGEPSGVLK